MTSTSTNTTARLSALLISQDSIDRLQTTLHYLAAQTVRDRIELVFVTASRAGFGHEALDLTAFAGVQVVEIGILQTREAAYATAVQAASAPLVVLMEDHCWPEPGWAEALLAAHDEGEKTGGYAAVGPLIINANPENAVSWAHMVLGFGPYLSRHDSGLMPRIPAHNSCYRREILLAQGNGLANLLTVEVLLHDTLTHAGQRLYLATGARTHHVNMSRPELLFSSQLDCARTFGARRSARWPLWKRAVYCLGSPLIPFVLFSRMAPDLARAVPARQRMGVGITLFLTLCVVGLGEFLGYARGAGNSRQRMMSYELDRFRFVTERDKQSLRSRYAYRD